MTKKTTVGAKTYTPEELKVLFEALAMAPSYLSKRFILKHMLAWDDEDLKLNMTMMDEEQQMKRIGKTGAY